MNVLRYSIILCMTIALSGCSAARPKPLAQPEEMPIQGTYTHSASGMTFPAKIGDFDRRAVLRKDTQRQDASVRYDLISMAVSVAVTVDIYPAPKLDTVGLPAGMVAAARDNLSQQAFESHRREIMSSHPGTVLIQEGEVSLPQSNNPYGGRMAVIEYEDVFFRQRQLVRSQLYLFCFAGGKWVIKYQFIYPKNADVLQEIENFLMKLSWTLKGPKPATSR